MEKYLFHYTTLEALDKILGFPNLSIRLTNSAYTNDKTEGIFFYQQLRKWIGKYENINFVSPELSVISVLDSLCDPSTEDERYGIFCLTPKENDLTMWRFYGNKGEGVSIGFDLEKILSYLMNQPKKEVLSSYPEIEIQNTLDWAIVECEYMSDDLDMDDVFYNRIYQQLHRIKIKGECDFTIMTIMMMPNVAKHSCFKDENEYRLFKNKNLNYQYEGGKLYDYIEIPLKFVSRIYIGPCNIGNSKLDEIKRKLYNLTENNSIEIIQSELPYRN